jgi:hypothetical protein
VAICREAATAVTVTLRLFVALNAGALESITFTVNDDVPAAVGVPLICPAPLSVKPFGKAPELSDQLYGVFPPVAVTVAEYALPTCPLAKLVVVTWTDVPAGATVRLRLWVADFAGELESVTCTVNEKLPACVGVPVICPELERSTPGGNEPVVTDQL